MDYNELMRQRNSGDGLIKYLGMAITELREGFALAEMPIEPSHRNLMGAVHGGAVFALADTASGAAALSFHPASVTTSGNIEYLNAAIHVKKLVAEAVTLKHGKRLIVNDVTIRDESGHLIAKATLTHCILRQE